MNRFKVIVIDDERLAREEMKRSLAAYPELEIVGEAANADEAELLINTLQPALIFLDIQMPGRSGFDLLEGLTIIPEVIFTTAFDQYAVKAFELSALDYLVKPIRQERLEKAMEKARNRLNLNFANGNALLVTHSLFVKEGDKYHLIPVKDIYVIESIGNYVRLYFNKERVFLKRSLSLMERALDESVFFRINRTLIVNTTFIRAVDMETNGRLVLTLANGDRHTVSSRQTAVFKTRNLF
ncbi:LytTR family DNA-binding domain-containing protein [Pedobacter sp. Hv1]|uniref:LytR/AlgR family response regulator transcription factor n=1 Tax=Pedobacter sp. Hv1 TaxID=1740090 RepID=UPI0006D8C317|nr:LytTR family DNA-binding domain-containing protein [Pedobacter sp. Hv1]KQC01548.1 two-component system response regulator [Pedobacter sp. Hv1]